MVLEFIPLSVGAIIFVVGLLGLVANVAFARKIATVVGSPLGLKVNTALMVMLVLGVVVGGAGYSYEYAMGLLGTATVTDIAAEEQASAVGNVEVALSAGLSNATTTEDYLNDAEDQMTIYSADANIADGEEYSATVTITRSNVADAGLVRVTCTIPDKEISGVTADNLAEKTSGKIDLDLNDGGTHLDDNTVYWDEPFAVADNSETVTIAFDQEETYHDGMVDMDDYVDVNCDAAGVPFSIRIIANS
mgnify:FL=1